MLLLKRTGRIVAAEPLFGVGFGHFVDAQGKFPADPVTEGFGSGTLVEHNILLNMAAETGLIGLGIYVALFAALLRQSVKTWQRTSPEAQGYLTRGLVALFWVMLANYLVSGMFRDMLWDPFANALLWALAGLTLGMQPSSASAEAPPELAT